MKSTNSQKKQPEEEKDYMPRRKAPRFDASAIPTLRNAYLVQGDEIKLINISRGGALVETPERLSPGSRVSLDLVTTKAVYNLKGRILRSFVYEIGKVPLYQCAIAFDEELTILPSAEEVD